MSDQQDDDPKKEKKKNKAKPPSKYADAPYEVGKGKPPKANQFQPGNKGGGRKPGSTNKSDLEKLLNSRIIVGEDRLGRPIRKTLREAINRKLIKKALDSDMPAMRLIKETEFKFAELERRYGEKPLTAQQAARKAKEDKERAALNDKFARDHIALLELMPQLKKRGIVKTVDGRFVLAEPSETRELHDEDDAEG